MLDSAASSAQIAVHGLLVCRNVEPGPDGQVTLENVLEVIALDALPGDAGPLTFVAFLRNVPPGPAKAAFVIRSAADGGPEFARLPLESNVPEGFARRQLALQIRLPKLPVTQGGWFEVVFEWEGAPLARTRFAVGARSGTGGT